MFHCHVCGYDGPSSRAMVRHYLGHHQMEWRGPGQPARPIFPSRLLEARERLRRLQQNSRQRRQERESAGRSPGHGHRAGVSRPRAVVVPRPPGTDDDLHRPTPRCCWATRTVAETPGGGRIVGGSAAGSRSVAESTDTPGQNWEFQFPELGEPVDDDRFDDSDIDRASYTPGQTTDEEQASSASGPVDPAGFDPIASTERRAAPIYRAPTPPDVAALSLTGDAGGTSAGAGPPLTRHVLAAIPPPPSTCGPALKKISRLTPAPDVPCDVCNGRERRPLS